jgi:hypothetical protein
MVRQAEAGKPSVIINPPAISEADNSWRFIWDQLAGADFWELKTYEAPVILGDHHVRASREMDIPGVMKDLEKLTRRIIRTCQQDRGSLIFISLYCRYSLKMPC